MLWLSLYAPRYLLVASSGGLKHAFDLNWCSLFLSIVFSFCTRFPKGIKIDFFSCDYRAKISHTLYTDNQNTVSRSRKNRNISSVLAIWGLETNSTDNIHFTVFILMQLVNIYSKCNVKIWLRMTKFLPEDLSLKAWSGNCIVQYSNRSGQCSNFIVCYKAPNCEANQELYKIVCQAR